MAHSHTRTLPADLSAPEFVTQWQRRALLFGAIATVAAVVIALIGAASDKDVPVFDHVLRAWLLGYVFLFGLAIGALALLMMQYVSGGKWGLLIRRALEAMTRTIPVVFVLFLPIGIFARRLYQWAQFPHPEEALKAGLINEAQAHAIAWKHPMLNPTTMWIVTVLCFLIWGFYALRLNKLSLRRDTDTLLAPFDWQKKMENYSGFGVLVYSITLTAGALYWVLSLDVTWYSSVYGLIFLVGQGYSVLALSIYTVVKLSRAEPMHTILRVTEQHDLAKFLFGFVMLNIYLNFAQYLIIWSGNLPEEIPWYLNRIRGHWGVAFTLDFLFHWVIPFSILLSRDIKRNKKRLAGLCLWMLFARCFDLWILIEPNFADAKGNLHFSFGMLEYIAVPAALISFWAFFYLRELKARALVATNDPHLAEILEPEHAH